jgi:predicted metalloprotease with PDZ domain
MKSVKLIKITSLIFLILSGMSVSAQTKIAFTVSFSEPQAHYADIQMEISGLSKDFIDVKMPVWAPGSYLVREFSKSVESVSAKNGKEESLQVQKTTKNTWRISSAKSAKVTLNYRVYAYEISVRTSFIDASRAFLSSSGIFVYPDGMINNPVTVTIKPYTGWTTISTGMESVAGDANTFYAPDFDILYDSPIEIGTQDVFEFNAAGVRHQVAMTGGGTYKKDSLKRDLAKIVEEETKVYGENPNKRYVFLVQNYATGGGGLEHLNSTVLGASRLGYSTDAGYKGFLGLASHEYFHLWNVKRLRPKALGPFNYDEENYTTNLWVAEGFTSYYGDLILERAGFTKPEKYLEGLLKTINAVENQPGGRIMPVSQSSFDAWVKYYRPNENSNNSSISYYDKGSLIGLLFDLEIIAATKGEKSLDDLMKAMYDEYYKKQKRGYTDAEFRAMAEKVAGKSFDKIYNDYINGTLPIDYNSYFEKAGLRLINDNQGKNDPYLGIASAAKDGKFVITNVSRNSAAWKSGLNTNDELIAIDDNRITTVDPLNSDINRIVSSKKPGETVRVLVSRDGLVKSIDVVLGVNPNMKYRFEVIKNASDDQYVVRKKWLRL